MARKEPKVAIIMGSSSDIPTMKKAANLLMEFDISFSMNVFSAHRTPEELDDFVFLLDSSEECEVIITGAGMSAALSGCVASKTTKPVIGVPLSGSALNSLTALLSTVQMPPGIPVPTVGVDAAENAALSAISIIALHDPKVKEKLQDYRERRKAKVLLANHDLVQAYPSFFDD